MGRFLLLDNTLREGEQVPGLFFTPAEKARLRDALDAVGVDLLDVGIPATSPEDAAFAATCAGLRATAGASVRARPDELDQAAALGLTEIYLMCPASELHLEHKFGLTEDALRDRLAGLLEHADRLGLGVNLVAEDASRGSPALVLRLARFAAGRGVRRLLLCDTVGAALPSRWAGQVAAVVAAVPRCPVGVHCHDDHGLATANTLAALEAGAQVASVTVNGLGERAGNAPLHEVVVGAAQLLGRTCGVDPRGLADLSALVEELSGIALSPLAPMVGLNAFRHESGIHVDGLLKEARVYEQLQPEVVGRRRTIVLGRGSGVGAVQALLARRGWTATEAQLRGLVRALQLEKRQQDKGDAADFVRAGRAHYESTLGFPEERFWALAEALVGPA